MSVAKPPVKGKEAPTEVKMLFGGKWESSGTSRWGEVFNPSTGRVIARVPFCTTAEVDQVAKAAADAQPAWAETPVVERARVMFRFREKLTQNF
ncbi:MAG: aldehyde dehydrogenase family protein, partial [Planctomycetes bacterium]|nr:aldehyde dehydrogenase family protein [Planctomycetota bacterium]